MEPSEAIAFLRRYNHWRRGGEMDQPHPYQIGQAIDAICDHAERMERELDQEQQDRKQAEADVCRALGERNDARKEVESYKATLANLRREMRDAMEQNSRIPRSGMALGDLLSRHGIIKPEALDDPEGFDGHATLDALYAALEEMMKGGEA